MGRYDSESDKTNGQELTDLLERLERLQATVDAFDPQTQRTVALTVALEVHSERPDGEPQAGQSESSSEARDDDSRQSNTSA